MPYIAAPARLFLTTVLSLCATAAAPAAAPVQAAADDVPIAPPADPQKALEALKADGAELERRYAALEAALRQGAREQFDPQTIIEQVGRDPAALAGWVRDRTDLLPYRGALRGSRGVLMDRGGNSLDRSLLLADLLSSAGNEVRLANATLAPEQAHALAAKVGPRRANHPERAVEQLAPDTARNRDRVNRHAQQILSAMKPGAAADADAAARVERALSDHWWVQRRDGDAWVDVDPCGVDPAPAPARTVDLKSGEEDLPLESTDCHEVTFRLMVEAFKDGKLSAEPVMTQTMRPIEVLAFPLRLTHYADSEAIEESLYLPDAEGAVKLRKALSDQKTFLPVLHFGPNALTDASFNTAGEIDHDPNLDNAGKMSGGVSGVFGGGLFGGGGGGKAEEKPDVLTAEWIEYEVRVPGEPPHTVRRMVFDLIGPAARAAGLTAPPTFSEADKVRRSLMLTGVTQILLQPCDLAPAFVYDHFSRGELKDKKAWLSITQQPPKTVKDVTGKLDANVGGVDFAHLVAMARGPLGPTAASTYIDRPNIIHHRMWGTEMPDGTTGIREAIDLAFTATASLRPATPEGFAERVTQGVADTLAEQLGAERVADADAAWAENTVRLFERAAGQQTAPVVARSAADLTPLGLPPDVAARAASDLAAGHVLVLAKLDTGRSGWWRVHATTGQTVGVMDDGYHSTTVEYKTSNRPPAGPARAEYLKKMMGDRFNKLDARAYHDLIGKNNTLYMDEWEMVLQLQGNAGRRALSLTQEIMMGRLRGF